MKILEVKNIFKSYSNNKVLKDINIYVNKGELISLLGVSGVGKTTLFNIIAGVLKPDSGSIILENKNITGESGHISYMLQKDLLLEHKTIIDNVSLPLLLAGHKKDSARAKVGPMFKTFGLEGTELNYPKELSGGMRQRAALMRTYTFSDHFALLDEPFSALDTITKSNMHDWFLNLMEEIKLSTIFITHDIDEAILLSDRIYIMTGKPGQIRDELILDIKKPRSSEFLLSSEFLDYKRKIIDILNKERVD